jgi:hypothetical protein
LRIEFRPATLGPLAGTVTIQPSGEDEPDVVVPLSGQGIARR